jgi:hypothetical protein
VSKAFYVTPAEAKRLSFRVHPSRAPVQKPGEISGVALPLDKFGNLIVQPLNIAVSIVADNKSLMERSLPAENGVAWFRANSGPRAGAVQITASTGDISARRVVQQVASDPCNLRIQAHREAKAVVVQTDPVHDCSGNPVPDGTIVSFEGTDAQGKSTVDAPTKKGIARAEIPMTGAAVISAASGVVMGNQLRIGEQR